MNNGNKSIEAETALNDFFKALFIEEKDRKIKIRDEQLKKNKWSKTQYENISGISAKPR